MKILAGCSSLMGVGRLRTRLLECVKALRTSEYESKRVVDIDRQIDSALKFERNVEIEEHSELLVNILGNLLSEIEADNQRHLLMLLRHGLGLQFGSIAAFLQVAETTTTLPESLNQKISQFLQNSLPAILMMLVGN